MISNIKTIFGKVRVYKSLSKTFESATQSKLNLQPKDEQLWKFELGIVRNTLVVIIIVEELPSSFVEKKVFEKFMSIANL